MCCRIVCESDRRFVCMCLPLHEYQRASNAGIKHNNHENGSILCTLSFQVLLSLSSSFYLAKYVVAATAAFFAAVYTHYYYINYIKRAHVAYKM